MTRELTPQQKANRALSDSDRMKLFRLHLPDALDRAVREIVLNTNPTTQREFDIAAGGIDRVYEMSGYRKVKKYVAPNPVWASVITSTLLALASKPTEIHNYDLSTLTDMYDGIEDWANPIIEDMGFKALDRQTLFNLSVCYWPQCMSGQFWHPIHVANDIFENVFGSPLPDIEIRQAIDRNISIYFPYDDFCIMVGRVSCMHVEAQNNVYRLHNEDGPAIGWGELDQQGSWFKWYINGVKLDRKIVEDPQSLTVQEINAFDNAEVRRIATMRFGVDHYLAESGGTVIHRDEIPVLKHNPGGPFIKRALIKMNTPFAGRTATEELFLWGQDGSTGRTYFMPIDPALRVRTCAEAHRSICGIDDSKIVANS